MSEVLKQSEAVIVVAFMYSDNGVYQKAKDNLISILGDIEIEGNAFDFSHSRYYESEMGSNLKKRLVVFKKLRKRDYLVKIKLITNKLEKNYSEGFSRKINIDPAILTLENFILATNKNFTHRVYLRKNIFADLTLIYQKKQGYTSLPWTYLDYKDERMTSFLNDVRKKFYDRLLLGSPFKKN